jgi:predicted dinucleotide-binding enzyme
MARALGRKYSVHGHEVCFGSRDLGKAKAFAAEIGNRTQGGSNDDAATFGDIVIHTVRGVMPSAILKSVVPLAGKIIIDINNREIPPEFAFDAFEGPSLAERLAADVPQAKVVKAFNTVFFKVIEMPTPELAEHQVSVYVASDDQDAKRTVSHLAAELGFDPVNSGGLSATRMIEATADFLRFLMFGEPKLSGWATFSMRVLPSTDDRSPKE